MTLLSFFFTVPSRAVFSCLTQIKAARLGGNSRIQEPLVVSRDSGHWLGKSKQFRLIITAAIAYGTFSRGDSTTTSQYCLNMVLAILGSGL